MPIIQELSVPGGPLIFVVTTTIIHKVDDKRFSILYIRRFIIYIVYDKGISKKKNWTKPSGTLSDNYTKLHTKTLTEKSELKENQFTR